MNSTTKTTTIPTITKTSVDVNNFNSTHYHYRTHNNHYQFTNNNNNILLRNNNNENKIIAGNNRTMDSLNYWKRAFGNPEQTLSLGEKIIKVGCNGIQQQQQQKTNTNNNNNNKSKNNNNINNNNNNSNNNKDNLPLINSCFPVIKDRKSTTTTTKCKFINRTASKTNLKTLSPIQNSPQFLDSSLAQLAQQQCDNETDVKLSKFILQFASTTKNKKQQKAHIQTKYPVEKKKINYYNNNYNNNDGIENINSIYNNNEIINYNTNNLKHLEKKRKVELSINKLNNNLIKIQNLPIITNINCNNNNNNNELIKNELNYTKHENLIEPLKSDLQLSSSTSSSFLSKLVIYNNNNNNNNNNLTTIKTTKNCDNLINNNINNNNNNNNSNNSLFNNDFDYNSDIILSGNTAIKSTAAETLSSTTGRYDDEDGTLVFAIEI